MTIDEAQVWIKQQEFVYAKSYSLTFPHFYTTRDRCDEQKFEEFISLIRNKGKLKTFHRKQYLYLEIGEYEYWEMGRPLQCVQVLNKAKINDGAMYRYPTPTHQEELLLKAKLIKRDLYLQCLLDTPDKTEDQMRQVAFLMNTTRRKDGGGKNIIDHSNQIIRYE